MSKKTPRKPLDKTSTHAKYLDAYPEILRMKAEEDPTFMATIPEIVGVLGCSISGFHKWRHEHPDFAAAVDYARNLADERLERVAYERATGLSKTSTVKVIERPDGTKIKEKTATFLPPDPMLMKFILMNRRPEKWKEKISADVSGSLSITFESQDEGVL